MTRTVLAGRMTADAPPGTVAFPIGVRIAWLDGLHFAPWTSEQGGECFGIPTGGIHGRMLTQQHGRTPATSP